MSKQVKKSDYYKNTPGDQILMRIKTVIVVVIQGKIKPIWYTRTPTQTITQSSIGVHMLTETHNVYLDLILVELPSSQC